MPAAPDRKINDASANQLIVWDKFIIILYFYNAHDPEPSEAPGPSP